MPLSDEERARRDKEALGQLIGLFDEDLWARLLERVKDFEGDFTVLESALGALLLGQFVGWRVLMLVHSRRTFQRYQKVLGLDFRESMPERGAFAEKSKALWVADKLGDFWKVVRREVPAPMGESVKAD